MTQDKIFEVLVIGLSGASFGLIGKIIWDWLKGNRNVGQQGGCLLHQSLVDDYKEIKKSVSNVEEAQTSFRERLARIETLFVANSQSIKEDLERGRKLFASIETSMQHIRDRLFELNKSTGE